MTAGQIIATPLLSLHQLAVVSFVVQFLILIAIVGVSRRVLSVAVFFGILWIVYFPLRLTIITFGGPSLYYFPAVNAATGPRLLWMWNVLTMGIYAFLVGVILVSRRPATPSSLCAVRMTYWQYLAVGSFGLSVAAGLFVSRVNSGILTNIGALSLFGIAGAAYYEKIGQFRKRHWFSIPILLCVAGLGYLQHTKEVALMPILAWLLGRACAGSRVRGRQILILISAVALSFGMIQGERYAHLSGVSVRNPVTALKLGASHYNLAHGTPEEYRGIGIVSNILGGTLYRLRGADYFLAIAEKVPSVVPYQNGRSLWEPALTIIPDYQYLFSLAPQYSQLSLGRYIDQTFIYETPTADTSSQSTTAPGDLYLNFGSAGVAIGLLLLGAIYGVFDRRYPIHGATGGAIVAFAGSPLIQLDSNLAYMLVTVGLRLAICLVLLRLVLPSRAAPTDGPQFR